MQCRTTTFHVLATLLYVHFSLARVCKQRLTRFLLKFLVQREEVGTGKRKLSGTQTAAPENLFFSNGSKSEEWSRIINVIQNFGNFLFDFDTLCV